METRVSKRAHQSPLERRDNQLLREHFDSAVALLKPLLGKPESRNGTGFYRAMSQLQTTYPDLSASEIEALVAAVVRTFQNQGR